MKVAICDDDYLTCQFIEKAVLKYAKSNNITVDIDISQSRKALYENFEENTDLLFLDIMLPDSTGIEIGHFLRKHCENTDLQIIFISSNPGYAMDLFKIRPMDFLIKPFSENDITELLEEYFRIRISQMHYFIYKSRHETGKVLYKDIMFFSSEARQIHIYLVNNKIITIYGKLSDIESDLDKDIFWRIHKSYIVNKHYISTCKFDSLYLVNNQELAISKSYRKDIQMKIMNE